MNLFYRSQKPLLVHSLTKLQKTKVLKFFHLPQPLQFLQYHLLLIFSFFFM